MYVDDIDINIYIMYINDIDINLYIMYVLVYNWTSSIQLCLNVGELFATTILETMREQTPHPRAWLPQRLSLNIH